MNSKKKNKILALLILLLAVTLGYALLSTTLKINGTSGVSKNVWKIYWDAVGNVKSSKVTITEPAAVDADDDEQVNFAVRLDEPGAYYEFQVDAVNGGTIDAFVNIVTVDIDGEPLNDLPDYIKYSITLVDNSVIPKDLEIKAGNRQRCKVRIEYDMNLVDEEDIDDDDDYPITINLKATQAEKIDPCPGCVYAFYNESNKKDCHPSHESILTDYTTDYTTLKKNGEQRKVFIGHVLGENNVVTKFYVCTIIEDEPFCLQGTGSSWAVTDDTLALYESGKSKLMKIYGKHGEYNDTTKIGCFERSDGSEYYCSSDKTQSHVYNFGSMSIYGKPASAPSSYSGYDSCHITSAGDVYCIEG